MKTFFRWLLLFVIIALSTTGFMYCEQYFHDRTEKDSDISSLRYYSEEKEDNANVILMISNQDLDNIYINLKGDLDGKNIFKEMFYSGDQHYYTYYYLSFEKGSHDIKLEADDKTTLILPIEIKDEQDKYYFYVTLYKAEGQYEVVLSYKGDKPPGLD